MIFWIQLCGWLYTTLKENMQSAPITATGSTNEYQILFKWMTAAEHKLTDIPNLYIHFHSLSLRSSKIRAACFSWFCLYSRDDLDRPSRWWKASTFHFVHSLHFYLHISFIILFATTSIKLSSLSLVIKSDSRTRLISHL